MKGLSNRIFLPGNRYLIAYLTVLSSFPPISTDMYLPALPELAADLNSTNDAASASLTLFFLVYAFSTLLWGPLSDKWGRKPVLIAGSLLYMASSLAIALTSSIWTLLIARGVQALGCGAGTAMSLAIVKDVLRGDLMEKVVGFIQAAHVLAPVSAPLLGGLVLMFAGWRVIFVLLMVFGVISLAGALCLKETGRPRKNISMLKPFKRMAEVLKNKSFLWPLLIFSALVMPFMSYLAVSAFVYQSWFKLSPQAFSLFFAFNAAFSLGAPLTHIYFLAKLPKQRVLRWEMAAIALFGGLIILFGGHSAWAFAALMAPVTFCGAAIRPPSTVILMQSVKGDNGVVSSLIQCGAMLCATLAMFLAALPFWPSPSAAIGWIAALTALICLICWIKITRNEKGE